MKTTPPTLQNLLDQMKQNDNVLNGWDVVFNVLIGPLNQLFRLIFVDRTPATWKTIDVSYCQVVPNPTGDGNLVVYTDLTATLKNPSLTFLGGNESFARVEFAADGSLKTASKAVGADFDPATDCEATDRSLKWNTTTLASTSFVATVPLTVLGGRTTQDASGFRVVLDFPAGSFHFPTLAKQPEPKKLDRQLRTYFANNNAQYILNEVNTKVVNQLPSLTPTKFKLNTVETNAGKDILQFFITTEGTESDNLTVNVNEPVPDGNQCTLMVSQEITDQLGGASYKQVSLFAIENLAFPGKDVLQLDGQYTPKDMLVVGGFHLGDRIAIVSGDKQRVPRTGIDIPGGEADFAPLQVKVTDVLGTPHANTGVAFAPGAHPAEMAVQLDPSGSSERSTLTDPNGIATLDAMIGNSARCYYAEGPFEIVATAPGGATATFSLTVDPTPPPPNLPNCTVTIVSGDKQSVPRTGMDVPGGDAYFAPLQVVVKDPKGHVVPNALVNWAAGTSPTEMAVQLDPSGSSERSTFTDANGIATLNKMPGGRSVYCYYGTGDFEVQASIAGGGTATFTGRVSS